MPNFLKSKKGSALLVVIIILAAAGLMMGTSILYSGLGELDMGFTYQCGEEAFSFVDGCLEESLIRLKLDSSYNGGSFTIGNGNCIINIAGDAANKIINATSSVGNCMKRMQATAFLDGGNINIINWEEK